MQSKLERTFVALGDSGRLAVVRLLRKRPLRSSEIADALAMTRPTMSRHLKVLREAGLVEEESVADDARGRVYRLRHERFDDLRAWLDDVEAFWTDQLRGFKTHVERKRGGRA